MTRNSQQQQDTAALFDRLIPGWDQLRAHMQAAAEHIVSLNGVHTRGMQPRPLTLNPSTGAAASQRVGTSAGTLRGWSIREVAGAAAVIRLRSGQDANGDMLLTLAFNPSESTRDFPTLGIAFNGLFVEVVSGAVEGTLFTGPVGT